MQICSRGRNNLPARAPMRSSRRALCPCIFNTQLVAESCLGVIFLFNKLLICLKFSLNDDTTLGLSSQFVVFIDCCWNLRSKKFRFNLHHPILSFLLLLMYFTPQPGSWINQWVAKQESCNKVWRVLEEEETEVAFPFNSWAVRKCRLPQMSASVLGSVVCGEWPSSGRRACKGEEGIPEEPPGLQNVNTLLVTKNGAPTISTGALRRKTHKINFSSFH